MLAAGHRKVRVPWGDVKPGDRYHTDAEAELLKEMDVNPKTGAARVGGRFYPNTPEMERRAGRAWDGWAGDDGF